MTAATLKDLELSLLISVVAKRCIALSRRMNMYSHKWMDELKVTNTTQNKLFIFQKEQKIFYCRNNSALLHFEFTTNFVNLPPQRKCTYKWHF